VQEDTLYQVPTVPSHLHVVGCGEVRGDITPVFSNLQSRLPYYCEPAIPVSLVFLADRPPPIDG